VQSRFFCLRWHFPFFVFILVISLALPLFLEVHNLIDKTIIVNNNCMVQGGDIQANCYLHEVVLLL
jgi:hypothetical protein